MKHHVKTIAVCMALTFIVFALASCTVSKDAVVGLYSGEYTYNGNEFSYVIALSDDGTYARTSTKNGEFYEAKTGEYEIDGRDVLLYDSDSAVHHGSYIRYKYKNDSLENNGHVFKKI